MAFSPALWLYLALTARGETANRIEGLEAGADEYVIKPFYHTTLQIKLQQIGAV